MNTMEQNLNNRSELGIEELLRKKSALEEQLREINNKINTLQSKDSGSPLAKDENKIESKEVKFFSGKSNETLEGELSSGYNARFKIFNVDGNQAEFEYCGDITNEHYFDGIAKITNDILDDLRYKNNIIIVKPGIVVKDGDNWKVQQVMEIKYV